MTKTHVVRNLIIHKDNHIYRLEKSSPTNIWLYFLITLNQFTSYAVLCIHFVLFKAFYACQSLLCVLAILKLFLFFHISYGPPYSYSNTVPCTINRNTKVGKKYYDWSINKVFLVALYLLLASINKNIETSVFGKQ